MKDCDWPFDDTDPQFSIIKFSNIDSNSAVRSGMHLILPRMYPQYCCCFNLPSSVPLERSILSTVMARDPTASTEMDVITMEISMRWSLDHLHSPAMFRTRFWLTLPTGHSSEDEKICSEGSDGSSDLLEGEILSV